MPETPTTRAEQWRAYVQHKPDCTKVAIGTFHDPSSGLELIRWPTDECSCGLDALLEPKGNEGGK